VGKKKNKVWLIYAYHRGSGEIAAFVWGKRDLKTAKKLRKRIQGLGISYDKVATDDWDSFLSAFGEDNYDTGKKHTVGMKGIIAGYGIGSDGHFGGRVVFPRS
jgi:IS1 family transposase